MLAAGATTVAALGLNFNYVLDFTNGSLLKAGYRLSEDRASNPRLRLLRTREHLDRVVAPGRTQFEKIVLLRAWTRRQWEPGTRFYYPCWDAVEILDLARKVGNRGFCAQYAIVFLQACQSLGLHAQFVNLPGHFVVGVWSDDYNKWVIMDSCCDAHYERRGMPLGGGALCDAYWKSRPDAILRVGSDGSRTPVTVDDLAVFKNYAVETRANQLEAPVTVWWRGAAHKLVRMADYHNYPVMGRDFMVFWRHDVAWKDDAAREAPRGAAWSSDPEDFRYAENQTLLSYHRPGGRTGTIKVKLAAENSSTFRAFLVSEDGRDWRRVAGREVAWVLRPGLNQFRARILTAGGWLGPPSELTVFHWPALAGRLKHVGSPFPGLARWMGRHPAPPASRMPG
jgi:hypothetical protein